MCSALERIGIELWLYLYSIEITIHNSMTSRDTDEASQFVCPVATESSRDILNSPSLSVLNRIPESSTENDAIPADQLTDPEARISLKWRKSNTLSSTVDRGRPHTLNPTGKTTREALFTSSRLHLPFTPP